MNCPTRFALITVAALLSLSVGCSEGKYAPVSGVVTINGKPYGKAVVSFQPIGTRENPNPGRGSSAYTDENGKFVLTGDDGPGAVIGKHLVRIMTRAENLEATAEGGSSDETPLKIPVDPIPPEYNGLSKIEFEVPKGGTDQANFDIKSKTAPKN